MITYRLMLSLARLHNWRLYSAAVNVLLRLGADRETVDQLMLPQDAFFEV